MASDFYSVLGVEKSASQDEIKQAYRKLSKELHPDKHKGDKEVEKKYQAVNEAYETLSNAEKRRAYDQFGQAGGGAGGFNYSDFQGFNQQDFGGFSDIFESFFSAGGGRGRGGRRNDQGGDIEIRLTITLDDVLNGVTKKVRIDRENTCETCSGNGAAPGSDLKECATCGGTGQVVRTAQSFFGTIQQAAVCTECQGAGQKPEKTCPDCRGDGRVREEATVSVDVPAGIHEGQTLRLPGQGNAGRLGAEAGNLFVHIQVESHADFTRDQDDIRSNITVSVVDAILGTQVQADTLHGPVKLKIPAGSQPHQVFRLKGKGLPELSSSRHGDHFVKLIVEIPKKLSGKEKKLLEEWQQLKD